MPKTSPTKLRTLIREVYSDLKKSGLKQVMIHDLVAEATRRQPKLVEQEKDRLFRDAISAWTRRILKSSSDSLRTSQLSLPIELGHVILPVCIPVRPAGRHTGEAEWIETYDITFAQLDREISYRRTVINGNKELISLEKVRAYLAPHMAKRPDNAIGPVLAQLAEKEATAAKKSAA
jgi:hypothetical protein